MLINTRKSTRLVLCLLRKTITISRIAYHSYILIVLEDLDVQIDCFMYINVGDFTCMCHTAVKEYLFCK